jgi:hypothetical protein
MRISEHGRERVEERVGISGGGVDRLTARAWERGLHHAEATGPLRRYMDREFLRHGTAGNMRVYADKLWLFDVAATLITVLPLDHRLCGIAHKLLARKGPEGDT